MFLAMLIPFCILMFFYVIWRFFVIFGNNSKLIPLIIAIILTAILIGTFIYKRDNKIIDIIGTLSYRIFVLGFLLLIILSIIHAIAYFRHPINHWIIIGIIAIILLTGGYFSLHTKITNLTIQSDKIQKNTKILLISDIHVEHITQSFHVNKIIKTIEKEKPDFVIIAGDLMNQANSGYLSYLSPFKSIKNTPIFAVIGNHDVMGNTDVVKKIPEVSGIKLLNYEIVEVNGIKLIGLVDKSLRGNHSINEIMDYVGIKDDPNFSILITHQPIRLEKLKDYPIDLEVAGHTHRGQFYGIMELSRLANDYLYGEHKLGEKIAFVTQGIGTWGLPFRLGTQSEIVIINLTKK